MSEQTRIVFEPHSAYSKANGGQHAVQSHIETPVIGNKADEFFDIPTMLKDNQVMVDLGRITKKMSAQNGYDGICW